MLGVTRQNDDMVPLAADRVGSELSRSYEIARDQSRRMKIATRQPRDFQIPEVTGHFPTSHGITSGPRRRVSFTICGGGVHRGEKCAEIGGGGIIGVSDSQVRHRHREQTAFSTLNSR